MDDFKKAVNILEVRRLLFDLKEHRPDICIRYRIIGQMWAPNFLRVIHLTDKGVILNDETSGKLINILDMSRLMQFELDKPFQNYQPYFHYDVVPSPEWSRED
jgi:hypothetical protein